MKKGTLSDRSSRFRELLKVLGAESAKDLLPDFRICATCVKRLINTHEKVFGSANVKLPYHQFNLIARLGVKCKNISIVLLVRLVTPQFHGD